MKNKKTHTTMKKPELMEALRRIYQEALCAENFSIALKAIELLCREAGMFHVGNKERRTLSDFTDADLDRLIQEAGGEE